MHRNSFFVFLCVSLYASYAKSLLKELKTSVFHNSPPLKKLVNVTHCTFDVCIHLMKGELGQLKRFNLDAWTENKQQLVWKYKQHDSSVTECWFLTADNCLCTFG